VHGDPARERRRFGEWAPSKSLIASIRDHDRCAARHGIGAWLGRFFHKRRYQFWSVVTGADIQLGARLGVGLSLPHPNGVVIHRDAVIGVNCMLMQQVTLGQLAVDGAPRLGDAVYVGAGAKILGAVHVGDGAAVGANAVVLQDVPACSTAVGVPARIIGARDPVGSAGAR
jgi:serine O-acetyltransferase